MKKLVALFGLTLVSAFATAVSYENQIQFGVGPEPHVKASPDYDVCMDRVDRVFLNVQSEITLFLETNTSRSGLSYTQLYNDGLQNSDAYMDVVRAAGHIQSLETAAVRACGIRGYMTRGDADLLAIFAENYKEDFESAMHDYAQSH